MPHERQAAFCRACSARPSVIQDGTTQVTYNGHPLYYFIADLAAGMANGEGIGAFGARWEVINAAGMGVVK